ncbi:uncharacterized protein LOC116668198 [Camelus ferus]|uniref:Uncharacterized protein LOC116668198 n=1 Tax=Camelus ferus TaxID=419612 RepID=A0A8B8U8S1_CAMFR|nr:uncharacterized protein LOC116668198 [Camelus ferus]
MKSRGEGVRKREQRGFLAKGTISREAPNPREALCLVEELEADEYSWNTVASWGIQTGRGGRAGGESLAPRQYRPGAVTAAGFGPAPQAGHAPGSTPRYLRRLQRRRLRQARPRTKVAGGVQSFGVVSGRHGPAEDRARADPSWLSGLGRAPPRSPQAPPRLGDCSATPPLRPPRRPRPHRRRARKAWAERRGLGGEARLGRRASRGGGTDAIRLPGAAPREVGGGAAVVERQWERKRARATQVPHGALLFSPHASSSLLVACCLPTAALPDESFRSAVAEKPSPPRLGAE